MRKVVVGMLLSLDGVAEAPDRFFGWDDAVDASVPRLIATQDAVILGRHSYDEWVGFWPGSEIEPVRDVYQRGREAKWRPPCRWSRSGRTRT